MYARLAEIISLDGSIAVTLAAHQAIGLKVTEQSPSESNVWLFVEEKKRGWVVMIAHVSSQTNKRMHLLTPVWCFRGS